MKKIEEDQMNKWKQQIYEHLANYKKDELKVSEAEKFRNKEYGHILPKTKGSLNFLCPYIGDYVKERKIKKHMYWYHLNSSQVMCLNFFVPLIKANLLNEILATILGVKMVNPKYEFEKVIEKGSTNFDFYVKDEGAEYFFEIKYTEDTIDKKSKAKNISATYDQFYKKDCESNKLFNSITVDTFMKKHYQAYRNMVKASKKDYSIFIVMKDNRGVNNEINSALEELKLVRKTAAENNIIIKTWEDITREVIEILQEKKEKELVAYYERFKRKYLPD